MTQAPHNFLYSMLTCPKVFANAESLGADPNKVFTIGSSAGGGLALTVANSLIRTHQGLKVQGIIALAPVTTHPLHPPPDYDSYYNAYIENQSGVPLLDKQAMETYFTASEADPHDENVFVTLSHKLGSFPKTYIVTCGKDPLRDDGKVLGLMLEEEGVGVKNDHYTGLPHCFWVVSELRETKQFREKLALGVRWVLE